jgi:DNA-binding HxlR family transcriptional regulator
MTGSPICPKFHKAIELVGSRWTGAILQVLMAGPARFSTIREAVGDISDRMLSERLQELEREAIVSRTVLTEPPIRVEYALTGKGHELQSTLAAIARWAERWVDAEPVGSTDPPAATPHRARATRRTSPPRRPTRRPTA